MLFLEQARGQPGARGHQVGDPCPRLWSMYKYVPAYIGVE